MADLNQPDGGKRPRNADDMRSRIARLSQSNEERVARVEGDARVERQRINFIKRRQRLAMALSRVTRFREVKEFESIHASSPRTDFTVGELEDYLHSKLDMNCKRCGYFLRGLPHHGDCPECGGRYATGGFDWEVLRDLLVVELELPAAKICQDVWVLKRLREVCVEGALPEGDVPKGPTPPPLPRDP